MRQVIIFWCINCRSCNAHMYFVSTIPSEITSTTLLGNDHRFLLVALLNSYTYIIYNIYIYIYAPGLENYKAISGI